MISCAILFRPAWNHEVKRWYAWTGSLNMCCHGSGCKEHVSLPPSAGYHNINLMPSQHTLFALRYAEMHNLERHGWAARCNSDVRLSGAHLYLFEIILLRSRASSRRMKEEATDRAAVHFLMCDVESVARRREHNGSYAALCAEWHVL